MKKNLIVSVPFSAYLLAVGIITPGYAQVGAIAGTTAVRSILDNIKQMADDIINRLDQTISSNSFQIRQHIEILLSEVEHDTLAVEDKTFDDLSIQQKQLLTNVETVLVDANKQITADIGKLQDTATTISDAVGRLPLIDKSPRLNNYSPSYIVDPGSTDVFVTARGSFLNYGTAEMHAGGIPCKSATQIDNTLSFLCPGIKFSAASSIVEVPGTLIVQDYEGFWDKFKNVFRNYAHTKTYQLALFAVPQKLGDVRVSATYTAHVPQYADRSAPMAAGNDHCVGTRRYGPFNFSVQGGPGWTIVPGSIKDAGESSGNGGRSIDGPLNVTPNGFQYWINLTNSGSCGPDQPWPLHGKTWYDARAWMTRNIAWREVRDQTVPTPADLMQGPLLWGKDRAIPLPPATTAFRVEITQINGAQPIVITEDNTRPWFRVETDALRQTLLLRPREVNEALGAP